MFATELVTPETNRSQHLKSETLMSTDLDLAKQLLIQKNLSLVITKRGKVIFETEASGVRGLLEAIRKFGKETAGASAADRVVGRAAALLLTYSGVVSVFAITISESGVDVLKKHKIIFAFEGQVPRILNQRRIDVCPFEKIVAEVSDPKVAYEKLKAGCTPKQSL